MNMTSYKEIINEFIASTDPSVQQSSVSKLTDLLQNNSLTLLNFIQALQIYITSTNDGIRISTFTLLSQILNSVSLSKFFPKDIEVLMTFLFSKLLDKPVVKYVLSSIFSLISMKYFDKERTNEVMQNLIEKYNPKEYPQSIRLLALKIVNYLIVSTPQNLFYNDLAIDCFLHVSQNEKDPNNLLLIFQILQSISKNLDITNNVQNLFDTMFRYYPISFKSSTDSQESQINSLKDSLNSSLSSNDLYADELFPNLIEKYNSSTSSQVKLDILTTIASVSQVFPASIIQQNFLPIWNTLKYPIINQELAQLVSIPSILSYYENSSNESDQIFHSALIAVKFLAAKLDSDSKLLIFDDLSKNLLLSERNRRFLQSYLTLAIINLSADSINGTDGEEDNTVLQKTLSTLFSSEQPCDQVRNKRMLLVALSYFTSNTKFISELVEFRDNILTLLQSSLSSSALETTLRTLAIELTVNLVLSPTIISPSTGIEFGLLDEESSVLIEKIGDLLIENGLNNSIDLNIVIEKSLLSAISKLALSPKCENNILNQVITNILLSLDKSEIPLSRKFVLLNYLVKISKTPSLVQIVAVRLVNLLPNDEFDVTKSNLPVDIILQSLSSLFMSLPLFYNTNSLAKKFLPILIEFVSKQGTNVYGTHVTYVCEITRRLVVGLNNENAEILTYDLFNIFRNSLPIGEVEMLDETKNLLSFTEFKIVDSLNFNHMPILLAALQGLDVDVNIKSKIDIKCVLKSLIASLENGKDIANLTRIQVLVGLCVLFNKYLDWQDFITLFDESEKLNTKTLEMKVWCLYGMILKCNFNATESFVKLLNVLNFKQALKAIDIIFTPITEISDKSDEIADEMDNEPIEGGLNMDMELLTAYKKEREVLMMVRTKNKFVVSNLILRNMWKQRILEILLTKREEGAQNMDYILPLVLTYLPEDLYSSHLESLLPSLVNSIESAKDSKVMISILKIVCNVVIEESGRELLKPYVNTIIELCLRFLQGKSDNKTKELRKQSLRCLFGMCLFSLPVIVPYKKQVIKAAELTLNDDSRSVRMLGVSVRQSWEDLGLDLSL